MFENEILFPHEKIKKERMMLEATQKDIAGDSLTSNNICQIERDKQKLTSTSAVIIADNLNKIAESKDIHKQKITAEYLMEDVIVQGNRLLPTISDLEEYLMHLDKIEDGIKEYKLHGEHRIELYKKVADFLFLKGAYAKSFTYCEKGIEECIHEKNKNEKANFYIKKSKVLIKLQPRKALIELQCAEEICTNQDDEFKLKIYFNKSLAYKKIGQYDKSIKYLFKIKNELKINKSTLNNVKILYANDLINLKEYTKAEKEYIEILDAAMKNNNKNNIAKAYRNLAHILYEKGKYHIAAQYMKECIKNNPGNKSLNENLYFAGIVYKKINISIAEEYFKKALDQSKKSDRENNLLNEQILYELAIIYIKNNDEENISYIVNNIEELSIDCSLISAELSKYYLNKNNKEECMKHINNIINYIKKNKKI